MDGGGFKLHLRKENLEIMMKGRLPERQRKFVLEFYEFFTLFMNILL